MFLRTWIALLLLVSGLHADQLTFAASIDGKPAGTITVTIKALSDGKTEVHSEIDITSQKSYSLAYRGTETWTDGQLVRLEGTGSENGKKGAVSLTADKGGYALKAGAKEVAIRGDIWPTSFWLHPEGNPLLIVDAITGDVLRAKVDKVGADSIRVAGTPVATTHYRVTAGGQRIDLWYDSSRRLVRRTWSRDGHAIVFELTRRKSD